MRIHDLGELHGIKYLTMPYLKGHDLATLLERRERLPARETLRLIRNVVTSDFKKLPGAAGWNPTFGPSNAAVGKVWATVAARDPFWLVPLCSPAHNLNLKNNLALTL